MKRRMEHAKTAKVDPGYAAAKKIPEKKTEPDVYPTRRVPKPGDREKRLKGRSI